MNTRPSLLSKPIRPLDLMLLITAILNTLKILFLVVRSIAELGSLPSLIYFCLNVGIFYMFLCFNKQVHIRRFLESFWIYCNSFLICFNNKYLLEMSSMLKTCTLSKAWYLKQHVNANFIYFQQRFANLCIYNYIIRTNSRAYHHFYHVSSGFEEIIAWF